MTRAELRTYAQRALNDPDGNFLTATMANAVIEEAQELLAETGTPVVRRVIIPLRQYWTFYRLSAFCDDGMIPTRIYSTLTNRVLDPCTMGELDAMSATWETTTGSPTQWFPRGWDHFGIYPKPTTAGGSLLVDYAAWPLALAHDDAEPETPPSDHEAIALYAVYDGLLRGGQVEDALKLWQEWAQQATRGMYVKNFGTPQALQQRERP